MPANIDQDQVSPGLITCRCSVGKLKTTEFQAWKEKWDNKVLLVRWKSEGRNWEDIKADFEKIGVELAPSGWKSSWKRSRIEVCLPSHFGLKARVDFWAIRQIEALGRAAGADRDDEANRLGELISHHYSVVDAARIDYERIWMRISEMMERYGSPTKWSAEKAKYAWTCGVSEMFPHIEIRQRRFVQEGYNGSIYWPTLFSNLQ